MDSVSFPCRFLSLRSGLLFFLRLAGAELLADLFALIGISGESLSSFLVIFLKYMKNRRIVGGGESQEAMQAATSAKQGAG